MKQPEIIRASLVSPSGGPSPALLRAAAAWSESDRTAQLAAVLTTTHQEPPRFVLAAAVSPADDTLPAGAVLAECLPGRAAVVMTPQIASGAEALRLATSLLLELDQILRGQHVLLSQALTISRHDPATKTFLDAGYSIAGELLYLAANLSETSPTRSVTKVETLEFISHPPSDEERWNPLVERTYVRSLDCPAVDGLRPTSDVLAGYRDIGRPRDDWWLIARHAGRDVGCLILADHSSAAHAELVYMGLIPEVRGRGWGVSLAEQAKRIAAQSDAEQLVLSVDAANVPALRHYQTAGFQLWEQRTILIKSLRTT